MSLSQAIVSLILFIYLNQFDRVKVSCERRVLCTHPECLPIQWRHSGYRREWE